MTSYGQHREMGEKGRGEKGDANSGGASRLDNGAPRLDNFRGGGDADVSRNELLKAYKQAEAYRQENQRLKNQLDQVSESTPSASPPTLLSLSFSPEQPPLVPKCALSKRLVACDGVFFLPRCYVLAGGDCTGLVFRV